MFNTEQREQYERDGYVVLRNQFSEAEMAALNNVVDRNPPLDDGKLVGNWPEPGRYTLAKSSWCDADFVRFAEHPIVVSGAKELLNDDVRLTAYVMYDRTPGGKGIPPHHDYKRWRPVGSSLEWLFTIIPMCDFDEECGQLYIAPGSHHLDRRVDRGEGVLHMNEAIRPRAEDFIDPQLKRGDLLFMNMHLWHRAAGNNSNFHRRGLFNKYAAKHYPPATGYHVFSDDIYNLMSDAGKELIAVHSNKKIETTRLLLHRKVDDSSQFFFVKNGNTLSLPGGPVYFEDAIPDWDIGNYIGALQTNILKQIRLETPWVTYVGDYDEGEGLCRVYAYPMNSNGFPVSYDEGEWVDESELTARNFEFEFECKAIEDWLDPTMIRGKGLSQAKSRVDQFAY
ncbi:MAG: ectoine hydroxylase-related dioxygenase (phytanoyl-CoA dioxygenase family) [Candidatus Azotimanducaceae bacterium]|jgi:ectoine hydroxylase-related dioxygenase (phytanoyl-CoA dioxygenase family)